MIMWPNTGLWLVEKEKDGSWLLWGGTSSIHNFPIMYTSRRIQRYMSCPRTLHRSGFMKIKKRFISYLMQLCNKQFFTHGVKNESKKRFLGWCNNATGIFSHATLNFGFLKKRFFGWCNNATGRFSHDTLNFGFGEKRFFLGATVQQAFSHTHSGWR